MDVQREKTVEARHQAPADDVPFVNLADPARALGSDGKPTTSRRAPLWADVPDEKWNDWRWQLSHRVNDVEEIEVPPAPPGVGMLWACRVAGPPRDDSVASRNSSA